MAAAAVCFLTGQALAADPTGQWRVADGRAEIRIRPCGAALCGSVAATLDPSDRATVGTQILLDMKQTGPNRWEGRIYNPEDGQTYLGRIGLVAPNILRVEGCGLGGAICDGENWTRTR